MSYHLDAETSVGIRSFESFCNTLGLPTPNFHEKEHCYIVDARLAKLYNDKATSLFSDLENGVCLVMAEVQFLLAENTINAAASEWATWGWYNEGPRRPMELVFG